MNDFMDFIYKHPWMTTTASAALGLSLILGRFHGPLVGLGSFFLVIAVGLLIYTFATKISELD